MSESNADFNAEQFLVEHSRSRNIIVKASAGTGKTSVMIDRILFLIDSKDVRLSDIVMITFTNEATNQMYSRLQSEFLRRYRVTGNKKFLRLLEGISSIKISTIDSFALDLLTNFGVVSGFSGSVSVGSFRHELKGVVNDQVDLQYDGEHTIKQCMGVPLYEATRLVNRFYDKLNSLGLSHAQINSLDWGIAEGDANNLQRVLRDSISSIDASYSAKKRKRDSVPLANLIQDVLASLNNPLSDFKRVGVPYLFIDEFQDSNDAQIELSCWLSRYMDTSLFVVGDSKQSIYRFRGADDSAFDTLLQRFEQYGLEPPTEYQLVNNYRTDAKVLDGMQEKFTKWSNAGLLSKFNQLHPCIPSNGGGLYFRKVNFNSMQGRLVYDVKTALYDLSARKKGCSLKSSDRVVILTRSNSKLNEIAGLLENNDIPAVVRRDRPLFTSDAVRDFYDMVSSYVFGNDPSHLINYLCGPYSSFKGRISVEDLSSVAGNRILLEELMLDLVSDSVWNNYRDALQFEPVLSVIRRIIDEVPVIDNYVSNLKSRGEKSAEMIEYKVLSYKANLDKLLTILYNNIKTSGCSLYDLYEFLRISIATNRDEMEVDVTESSGIGVVHCMTVHKVKGLEFDTVIIPYDYALSKKSYPEILVSSDFKKVGWSYPIKNTDGDLSLSNDYYDDIKKDDIQSSKAEETRILYVAMTRAIRNLYVYVYPTKNEYSWSNILRGNF